MSTAVELSMNHDLLEAFLATDYLVDIDGQQLCVRIGQRHPAMDRALAERPWAILTADNPGARKLLPHENLERRESLAAEVSQEGLAHFPSTHRAQGSNWDDESGLLVLDPPCTWLHRQVRHFDQVGIVHGRPDHPAELWLYQALAGIAAWPCVVEVGQ